MLRLPITRTMFWMTRNFINRSVTSGHPCLSTFPRSFIPFSRDPFRDMQRSVDSFFRELERSMQDRSSIFSWQSSGGRSIPVETVQNGQRILKIEIDLPDFKPNNVNVTIKNGEVNIVAKYQNKEGSCKQSKHVDYSYSLPEDADLDKARSTLKSDGLLVIEIPLKGPVESKDDKEIPIKRE